MDEPSIPHPAEPADVDAVRIRSLLSVGLTLMGAGMLSTVARADGPFEPNETGAQAFGPLMGQTVDAAFETPQDVDWFRFYAKPDRQIGVLATMPSPCATPGSVRVVVYDADGTSGAPLISLTLGYTGASTPTTAANAAMTSQRGHRYLVKVTESLCGGVSYTLQVTPSEDLTSTLADTEACLGARRTARVARRRLSDLHAAMRHARDARRAALRRRWELQQQAATTATANEQAVCSRKPLTGYPYM